MSAPTSGGGTVVQLIHDGRADLIVNTPYGTGDRREGYDNRTAAVAWSVPCLTMIQALATAVQGPTGGAGAALHSPLPGLRCRR